MGSLVHNPKVMTGLVVLALLFLVGLFGGALGKEFGGGFLGSPLALIELRAEPLTEKPIFGFFSITNTMFTGWIGITLLAGLSYVGTRKISEIPGRFQCLLEIVLGFFLDIAESVAGPEKARRFFPLFMTIFLFVAASNWLGILPGFGTVGRFESADKFIHHKEESAEKTGKHLDLSAVNLHVFQGEGNLAYLPFGSVGVCANEGPVDKCGQITAKDFEKGGNKYDDHRVGVIIPFLRSANTDINTPLSIALISMFMVHFWGLSALGFGHVGKFLNFRSGFIGLFVGLLEAISEISRVISFTFRLFGNIFAGEVLLIAMAFLIPLVGLIPFLGLELFVGVIQAFIFAMLTLVFASTATISHEDDKH